MKVYTTYCVAAQIPYLGKSCFWDMGQNAPSQSACTIFMSAIYPEYVDEIAWFLAWQYKLTEIKSLLKFFVLLCTKMGVATLVTCL